MDLDSRQVIPDHGGMQAYPQVCTILHPVTILPHTTITAILPHHPPTTADPPITPVINDSMNLEGLSFSSLPSATLPENLSASMFDMDNSSVIKNVENKPKSESKSKPDEDEGMKSTDSLNSMSNLLNELNYLSQQPSGTGK